MEKIMLTFCDDVDLVEWLSCARCAHGACVDCVGLARAVDRPFASGSCRVGGVVLRTCASLVLVACVDRYSVFVFVRCSIIIYTPPKAPNVYQELHGWFVAFGCMTFLGFCMWIKLCLVICDQVRGAFRVNKFRTVVDILCVNERLQSSAWINHQHSACFSYSSTVRAKHGKNERVMRKEVRKHTSDRMVWPRCTDLTNNIDSFQRWNNVTHSHRRERD